MLISFDNDGHSPREFVSKEYGRFKISDRYIFGINFAAREADQIAERRPDGKWYTRRDWDAQGYSDFSISAGN